MSTLRRACCVIALGACVPGPPYHRPAAPLPRAHAYREAAWAPARPADDIPRGAWWTMFHEPELDALAARLDIHNQTIATAVENYLAARALIDVARAQYFPTVQAAPGAITGRASGALTTTNTTSATTTNLGTGAGGKVGPFTSYVLPLEATWAPDLFGRVRVTVRQRRYAAQVSAADLESTRLLAQATLVETYLQLRGQDLLQELLDETVTANAEIYDLTRQRFASGLENEGTVVQAHRTLEESRVQASDAGKLRAQYEHAIATLLGVPATDFTLPRRAAIARVPVIPVGAPSRLLERRPDIARAERAMAAANANVGIGYAAFYPTITLSGLAGFASTALSTLMSWPSRVWSIGGTAPETLLDGGARRATVAQAEAQYRATVAAYRQTVLVAFQEVEDALARARIVEREVEQQRTVVDLAERAFALEKLRYTAGLDPYTTLMLQQTSLLAARQALVARQVEQLVTAVALVRALGGGWDRALLPPP